MEIPEVVRPSYNPKCTYVLTLLNHIPTNEPIILLATHLKAKSSLECENIRLSQVQHMLSDVDQVMKESGVNRCIFLGDFNADPCPIHKRETIIEPLTVQYVLSWKNNFFSSVYDLPNDQNSTLYTTSKYRGGILSKHVIDYIFYSNGYLDVHSRLGQLDPSNIESNGPSLPNLYYPSDHIAIVADMILTTP